ncbi:MAG: glycosyltransferase family 39 protein, partial [Anaerolineae bacterium]
MDGAPHARAAHPATVRLLLLAVLLLACGLRFYGLDAQSLWNDEGSSVALAQRDPLTIARDAARDIHPPLYYWLLSGWLRLAGDSEVGVRSLSALLGVVLVALIYPLGRLIGGRWAGLAAAFVAAINPFQVYYAQEARMYMLLAVWGALAFYAALRWATAGPGERVGGWATAYVLAAAAGLYTHYAFPLVLVAANLALLPLLLQARDGQAGRWLLWPWIGLQLLAGLIFLPWLPAALRQLTTWPRVEADVPLLDALSQIAGLFTTGPAASPWPGASGLLFLLLLVLYPNRHPRRLRSLVANGVPILWLVLPVALILALGLFKDAYLKFLLVASPAFCLLAGRAVVPPPGPGKGIGPVAGIVARGLAGLLLLATAVYGLVGYFTDPAYARDDYRAIASYLEAVGRPGDAVVLNAPGQQEVFDYYYDGDLPVYPLPRSRPLAPAATRRALEDLAQPGGRVFTLLWATDESDPGRFVEGWLDSQAYKALDSWYGNVRLAVYAVPERAPSSPDRTLGVVLTSAGTGDQIRLLGYSLLDAALAAGDIAQITLFWQVEATPTARYKVFVHVLDGADQIVGQRDAEPGGGARLTTLWAPGETVVDNYGVPIHPATPPG